MRFTGTTVLRVENGRITEQIGLERCRDGCFNSVSRAQHDRTSPNGFYSSSNPTARRDMQSKLSIDVLPDPYPAFMVTCIGKAGTIYEESRRCPRGGFPSSKPPPFSSRTDQPGSKIVHGGGPPPKRPLTTTFQEVKLRYRKFKALRAQSAANGQLRSRTCGRRLRAAE